MTHLSIEPPLPWVKKYTNISFHACKERTRLPYLEMLQGCFLFGNNSNFLFEKLSFFVILPCQCESSGQPWCHHQAQYCPAKTFTFNMQRASEGKRQLGIVIHNLTNLGFLEDFLFFLLRSSSGIVMFV